MFIFVAIPCILGINALAFIAGLFMGDKDNED